MSRDKKEIKLENINKKIEKRLEKENCSIEKKRENIPFWDDYSYMNTYVTAAPISFKQNLLGKINEICNNKSKIELSKWEKTLKNNNIDQLMKCINFNPFSIQLYLNNIRIEKELTMKEIIKKSNFKDKYLSGVFTVKKTRSQRNPSRDCIIGLCFAFDLDLQDTNYLLRAAGYNELYLRNKRDLIIAKSILDKKNIKYTNKYLLKYGEQKIGNFDDNEAMNICEDEESE